MIPFNNDPETTCKYLLKNIETKKYKIQTLMEYNKKLLRHYILRGDKCSPMIMETINHINQKIVTNFFEQNSSEKLINILNDLKSHYSNNQIPESDYSIEMREKDKKGEKLSNSDRSLNETTFKICAMIINEMNYNESYLDSPSGIENVTKRDLLINFSKYLTVKGSSEFYLGLMKNNKTMFENIMDSLLNKYKIKNYENNAATIYKRDSWPINIALNSMDIPFVGNGFRNYDNEYAFDFIGYEMEEETAEQHINELTSMMHPLLHKSVTYRGGNLEELDVIRIDDGKGNKICANVIIQNFLNEHPNVKPKEIENFVSKLLKNRSLTKTRFMSTTCNKTFAEVWTTSDKIWTISNKINGDKKGELKIVWEIHADKGAKGLFMEQVNNIGNNYDDQYEFLFQRSSTLNFLNCHFDVKTGILTLKVKLSQGDNLLPFKLKDIPNQQYLLELKELYKKAKEGQDNDPQKFDEIKKKLYDAANGLLNGNKKIYNTIIKDHTILELLKKRSK